MFLFGLFLDLHESHPWGGNLNPRESTDGDFFLIYCGNFFNQHPNPVPDYLHPTTTSFLLTNFVEDNVWRKRMGKREVWGRNRRTYIWYEIMRTDIWAQWMCTFIFKYRVGKPFYVHLLIKIKLFPENIGYWEKKNKTKKKMIFRGLTDPLNLESAQKWENHQL